MSGDRETKTLTGANRRRERLRYWFDESDLAQELPPFAPDIIDKICTLMIDEGVSLSAICKKKLVEGAPNLSTIHRWRLSEPRIDHALRTAKAIQAETRFEELEEKIEEELNTAATSGDKVYAAAVGKKMQLLKELRVKDAQARVPAFQSPDSAVAVSTKDGATQVVVVPAKALSDNVPVQQDKALPPPRKRGVVVDLVPKKAVDK